MKKILLSMLIFGTTLSLSAQKMDFEKDTLGTPVGVTTGSHSTIQVVANTHLKGNASYKVLKVTHRDYDMLYFDSIPLKDGDRANYEFSKIRFKICVLGGTDVNFPQMDIFSAADFLDFSQATNRLVRLPWQSLWGNPDIGLWRTIEFSFSKSVLDPIPAGKLILQLVKGNADFLIDDIEIVPYPVAVNGYLNIENFNSNKIGDTFNMKAFYSTDYTDSVKVDPKVKTNKALQIKTTNYGAFLKLNVSLEAGKTIADYDQISYDVFLVNGFSNNNMNFPVFINDTVVYTHSEPWPKQAEDTIWTTITHDLINLAPAKGANNFSLALGISSNNANYYIDNIRLKQLGYVPPVTKIDFESATLGDKANVVLNTGNSGEGGVIENLVTDGINKSTKALRIAKAAYGNLNFPDLVLPEGAPATYAYWRLRCKIMPISGTGLDYPTLYFHSATNSTELGTKIGQMGPWGGTTLNKWVQCDFIITNSTLATIPAGQLALKFEKDACEYAIDDIEIVPGPNVSIFNETFESFAIGNAGGTVGADGVFANPATTGINTSAKALHKIKAGYGVINFNNIALPEGAPATYPLTIVKCKILVIGGTDTNYPQLYFGSAPAGTTGLGTQIGKYSPWGNASVGTWVKCQYILNNSTITNIPEGRLAIKLEKDNCEYAIDDVELLSNVPGYMLPSAISKTQTNTVKAYYYNNQIQFAQEVDKVEVFDLNGRVLVSAKNTSTVDLSTIGRGMYIVKSSVNGQNSMSKIIK